MLAIRNTASMLAALLLAAACGGGSDAPQATINPAPSSPAETAAPADAAPTTHTMEPGMSMPAMPADAPTTAPAAAAPAAGAKVFAFSNEGSKIEFAGSNPMTTNNGYFAKFTGEISLVGNDPAKSTVKVNIVTDSITTENQQLQNHLKTADFFDVPKFPEAVFTSTKIEKMADHYMVTGDLAMHGVTKNLTFPAKIEVSEGGVKASAEFQLMRFDWDIKFTGAGDRLIKNEALVKLDIDAKPGV